MLCYFTRRQIDGNIATIYQAVAILCIFFYWSLRMFDDLANLGRYHEMSTVWNSRCEFTSGEKGFSFSPDSANVLSVEYNAPVTCSFPTGNVRCNWYYTMRLDWNFRVTRNTVNWIARTLASRSFKIRDLTQLGKKIADLNSNNWLDSSRKISLEVLFKFASLFFLNVKSFINI